MQSPFTGRTGLYAIVDLDALAGRDPVAYARAFLAAGDLFALQLRAKDRPASEVVTLAEVLAWHCARAGVPFVVNDRADVALAVRAPAVHVGQDDLPPSVLAAAGPFASLAIGVSTHGAEQFDAGLASPAAYVALGPVFPTSSKRNPDPVVGTALLEACVARTSGAKPVVAIGGITLARVDEVRRTGAASAAVISGLLPPHDHPDPLAEATRRAQAFHTGLGGRAHTSC